MRQTLAVAAVFLLASLAAAQSPDDLTKAQHWKRARAAVEAGLKQNPNDAHLLTLQCRILKTYGKLDEAAKTCERSVSIDPKNWEAHWDLGQVYADQAQKVNFFKAVGFAGKVKNEFQAAVTANPGAFESHYALMEFYSDAPGVAGGDKGKARAEQQEVAKLSPAWGFMAAYDITPKDKKAAVQEDLYRKAHDAPDASYSTQIPYCVWLTNQKRWDEAQKCNDELVKRAPDRVLAYSNLAIIYASQSKWKELDALIAAAEKAVPDNLNPQFQAARVLVEAGQDLPRAERYLRHYLEQEPEPKYPLLSRAHFRLGQALEKQGKKQEAIAELQAAVKMEPDFKPAQEELKKLQ
jgi:tetratricopeptide (TPR) repeat protein